MRRLIVIIGLLLLNSEFLVLNSQNVIRPKIACPNDIYVNSYNGVLFYQRADISIPNRSMPLEAVFYYNSSSNKINYGYGNGWSLGCEYRYNLDSLGVIIETGDGRRDLYLANGTPALVMKYDSPQGVFHRLSYQMVIINNVEYHLFTLTDKDGTVYHFDDPVSKRVTQIKDRNNNVLNFSYTDGRLTTISDGNGRSLILTWTDSLLTSLGTNLDDRQWHYAYDTLGNLVSVINPMDYTVHYGYNRDNRISRFTDEEGYSTLITYNDDGMAHRIKTDLTDKSIRYEQSSRQTVIVDYMGEDANNQFTTYRWDTLGRVIEKTGNCCGYTSKLEYDEDNNVIRSEDANGNVTTCTYDTNGNMLSMTDPLGNTEYYTYEPKYNNPTSYTDKLGHQYMFTYDTNGNLTAINGPLGYNMYMMYDDYGQPLTITDANGGVTTYGYDQYGNNISLTNALGNTTSMQYNTFGDLVFTTSPTGATQQLAYDRLRRVIGVVDPLGNRTSIYYDKRGNAIELVNALQHHKTITYDALSRPTAFTDARQATTTVRYNAQSKPEIVEDALHHAVRMEYNDRNQVVLTMDALEDSTQYEYDAVGNVVGVLLPNGRQITYMYDALYRLVQSSDQYGVMQTVVYDAIDNVVAIINSNGDTTHVKYDALGRLMQITNPLGDREQYVYDYNGNLLAYTDAIGNTTVYTYDAVGNPQTETDAMNNVTVYTYNTDGNLSSVTDVNGNTTAYTYDAASRLIVITFANSKTQQFWYNEIGNMIRKKDESGNIILMTYDVEGNLLSRFYPDGSSDQYTYDLLGNMLTANNDNAIVAFTYDAKGQILSEALNGAATVYSHNTNQGRIGIIYPNGRVVNEQYDMRGRLTNILSGNENIATFSFTPTNHIASISYENGDQATLSYDVANRLTSIQSVNSVQSIISSFNYNYDASGNILSKIDVVQPEGSENYNYDALHRLSGFRRGAVNNSGIISNPLKRVQYSLDALGNRITTFEIRNSILGVETNYAHNNMNAYTVVGNKTMQYDGNGNMIGDGRHTYQYNYQNRMVSVDNGITATYQYDALGRRIRKTSTNDTTNYYYRGIQCIEERISGEEGLYVKTYIYGNSIDDILFMHSNNQNYFYHKNHLGSVVAITNNIGTPVEKYDYDPYGAPTIYDSINEEISESAIGNTIMFAGREYDNKTYLYNNRARQISITLGRFMQHDPVLYVSDYNLYTYVNNRPIIFLDNTGERPSRDEARRLVDDSYKRETTSFPSIRPSGGWHINHSFDNIINLNNPHNGLNSNVYSREINGKTEYAYVTNGTNPASIMDWINNFRQGGGFGSSQYGQSIDNARQLRDLIGDAELTYIGHSLGGGEAIANAHATGDPAIVFNPASLSPFTRLWYGLSEDAEINTYITDGEILDLLRIMYPHIAFLLGLHPEGNIHRSCGSGGPISRHSQK